MFAVSKNPSFLEAREVCAGLWWKPSAARWKSCCNLSHAIVPDTPGNPQAPAYLGVAAPKVCLLGVLTHVLGHLLSLTYPRRVLTARPAEYAPGGRGDTSLGLRCNNIQQGVGCRFSLTLSLVYGRCCNTRTSSLLLTG